MANNSPSSAQLQNTENLDDSEFSLRSTLDELIHLRIPPSRLTIMDSSEVGSGRYGEVLLATLDRSSQTSTLVAVKEIRTIGTRGVRKRLALRLAREVKIWAKANHPHVLQLIGYYLSENYEIARFISPFMANGNVSQYLNRSQVGILERLDIIRGITIGMDYLHSLHPPICHGDLKPSNVLVNDNIQAVLCDFGLASLVEGPDISSGLTTSRSLKGATRYMSPELLLGEDTKHTLHSDTWAWGCTAFEILSDKPPFHQCKTETGIIVSIIRREAPGQLDMDLSPVPDTTKPEYAYSLRILHSYLPLCWDYESRKRPPISLLRQRAFMFSFEDDVGDTVVATLEELAHLLIPPNRLRIVERSELGAGNYGEVVLGTLDEASPTARDVAVKRLKAVGTRGERVRLAKRLARELNIWAKINHPNVVELIGYYLDEKYESPLLISALMTNGNVLDYIESHKPYIEQRIAFVKGITAGLACLHNYGPAICHADLKPANVLVDLQMNAVLCDFGLASFASGLPGLSGLVTTTSLKGTPRYMSPELLLKSNCKHNLESDVWAWACTVFQVLTGRIPYAELPGEGQVYLAMDRKELPGDVALLLPNDAEVADSESALTLRFLSSTLPQCWDFNPQNRPSICTLLSHLSGTSPQPGADANRSKNVASGATQAQQVLPDPSSRRRTSFNDNKDVASGGLEEGMELAETLEDPPGTCAEVESVQEDKQTVTDEAQPEGDGAHENSRTGQDAPAINWDADREAQLGEDDKTVIPKTADRSSLKISIQPLSALIWATVLLILSLSANIVLVLLLRKGNPLPLRDQEVSRPTYQERDL